jgi:hypothetical protein
VGLPLPLAEAELDGHSGAGAGENRQGVGEALGDADVEAEAEEVVCRALGTSAVCPNALSGPMTAPNIRIEISRARRAGHFELLDSM